MARLSLTLEQRRVARWTLGDRAILRHASDKPGCFWDLPLPLWAACALIAEAHGIVPAVNA